MLKSMTGYGSAEIQDDNFQGMLEVRSYNSRYLDMFVNLPPYLASLEIRVRKHLSSRIIRGKIDVNCAVKEYEGNRGIDSKAALAYKTSLEDLLRVTGISDRIKLSHLMHLDGVFTIERKRDTESYWSNIERLLDDACDGLDRDRLREGGEIERDIRKHLDVIRDGIEVIDGKKDELEEHIRKSIKERFQELLGSRMDENRIYSETALLLVKFDINEELSRMRAHIDGFSSCMNGNSGIGKKLDFICQELSREINTIGSKSMQLDIHKAVIDLKNSVEKIREQLRNVE